MRDDKGTHCNADGAEEKGCYIEKVKKRLLFHESNSPSLRPDIVSGP